MRQLVGWDAQLWGVLSAPVQAGKQGNSWGTGGHTPPTVVHLENIRMRRAENVEKEIYAD